MADENTTQYNVEVVFDQGALAQKFQQVGKQAADALTSGLQERLQATATGTDSLMRSVDGLTSAFGRYKGATDAASASLLGKVNNVGALASKLQALTLDTEKLAKIEKELESSDLRIVATENQLISVMNKRTGAEIELHKAIGETTKAHTADAAALIGRINNVTALATKLNAMAIDSTKLAQIQEALTDSNFKIVTSGNEIVAVVNKRTGATAQLHKEIVGMTEAQAVATESDKKLAASAIEVATSTDKATNSTQKLIAEGKNVGEFVAIYDKVKGAAAQTTLAIEKLHEAQAKAGQPQSVANQAIMDQIEGIRKLSHETELLAEVKKRLTTAPPPARLMLNAAPEQVTEQARMREGIGGGEVLEARARAAAQAAEEEKRLAAAEREQAEAAQIVVDVQRILTQILMEGGTKADMVGKIWQQVNEYYVRSGASLEQAATLTSKALEDLTGDGEQLAASMQKAMRPGEDLAKQIAALRMGGAETSEIVKYLANDIISAAEAQKKFGTELPKTVAELEAQARAFLAAGAAGQAQTPIIEQQVNEWLKYREALDNAQKSVTMAAQNQGQLEFAFANEARARASVIQSMDKSGQKLAEEADQSERAAQASKDLATAHDLLTSFISKEATAEIEAARARGEDTTAMEVQAQKQAFLAKDTETYTRMLDRVKDAEIDKATAIENFSKMGSAARGEEMALVQKQLEQAEQQKIMAAELAEAKKKEAEEGKKVVDLVEKHLRPMDELVKKYNLFIAANGKAADFVKVFNKEILTATAAQQGFKQAISDTGKQLAEMAKKESGEGGGGEGGGPFGWILDSIKKLAPGIMVAFGGIKIGEIVAHWVNSLREFEEVWTHTMNFAPAGASAEEMSDSLLKMGGSLGSVTQKAQGLQVLLRSGFGEKDAFKILEQGLKLAAVSGNDARSSLELLRTALKTFGKDADEAGKVADTLWRIMARGGDVTAGTLQYGLAMVGATAKGLGFQLEDLGEVIAAMASTGMSGSRAIFALQGILTQMAKPTSELNIKLNLLGINIEQMVKDGKNFVQIMQEIAKVVGDNTRAAEMLGFSQRQLSAIMALVGSNSEAGLGEVKSLNEAFQALEGTTGHLMKELKNTVEATVLSVVGGGGLIKGIFNSMIYGLVQLFDAIREGTPWIKAAEAAAIAFGIAWTWTSVGGMAGIVTGIRAITAAIIAFIPQIKAATAACIAFAAANPWLLLFTIAAGALIAFKEDIADLVVKWQTADLEAKKATFVDSARFKEMTKSLGLTDEAMQELMKDSDGLGKVLHNQWGIVKQLKELYDTKQISLKQYTNALKTLIQTNGEYAGSEEKVRKVLEGSKSTIEGITLEVMLANDQLKKFGMDRVKAAELKQQFESLIKQIKLTGGETAVARTVIAKAMQEMSENSLFKKAINNWATYVQESLSIHGELPKGAQKQLEDWLNSKMPYMVRLGLKTFTALVKKALEEVGELPKGLKVDMGNLIASEDQLKRQTGMDAWFASMETQAKQDTEKFKAKFGQILGYMMSEDRVYAEAGKKAADLYVQKFEDGMGRLTDPKILKSINTALMQENENATTWALNTWKKYITDAVATHKDLTEAIPIIRGFFEDTRVEVVQGGLESWGTMIEQARKAYGRIPEIVLPEIIKLMYDQRQILRDRGITDFNTYIDDLIKTYGRVPEQALPYIYKLVNDQNEVLRTVGLAALEKYFDGVRKELEATGKYTPEMINAMLEALKSMLPAVVKMGIDTGTAIANSVISGFGTIIKEKWPLVWKDLFTGTAIERDRMVGILESSLEKSFDRMGQLPPEYLAAIKQAISSGEAYLQDKGLAMWDTVVQRASDAMGRVPQAMISQTVDYMLSGNLRMMESARGSWDYIKKYARDSYGRLPKELQVIDNQIESQTRLLSGQVAEEWQNAVSLTFDRLVDTASEAMIKCENLLDAFRDILRSFAKAILEMFARELFRPFMNAFKGMFSGQGFNLNLSDWFKGFIPRGASVGGGIAMAGGPTVANAATMFGGQGAATPASMGGTGSFVNAGGVINPTVWTQANIGPSPEFTMAAEEIGKKTGDAVAKAITKVDWTGIGRGMALGMGLSLFMDAMRRGGAAGAAEAGASGFMMGWGATGTVSGGLAGAGIGAGIALMQQGIKRGGKSGVGMTAGGGALAGMGAGAAASTIGLTGFAAPLFAAPGALIGGGIGLMADAWKREGGVGAAAESIGGGAMAGLGAAIAVYMLGGSFAGPLGMAIGAAIGAIVYLIRKSKKSPAYAGAIEAGRDLGISLGKDAMTAVYESIGLTSDTFKPIRKDIEVSPKFLIEVAGPAAKAAGTYDDFLKKLEKVETAWGTFNFRKAYELGDTTGDWSMLNYQFKEAFKNSAALKENLPDWETVLMGTVDVAKGLAYYTKQLRETNKVSDEFKVFAYENAEALQTVAESSYTAAKALALVNFYTLYDAMKDVKEISPLFVKYVMENVDALKSWAYAMPEVKSGLRIAEFETFFDAMIKGTEVTQEFTIWMKIWGKSITEAAATFPELNAQLTFVNFMQLFTNFMRAGAATDYFKKLIAGLGYSFKDFQDLADLNKLNQDLTELLEVFNQTGVILPKLREIYQKWGGDMAVLDEAALLPGLKQRVQDITDYSVALNSLLPVTSGLQDVLNGTWNEDTWGKLLSEGFDPSKLVKITDLTKYVTGWDQATSEFLDDVNARVKDRASENRGVLASALWKYGGEEGRKYLTDLAAKEWIGQPALPKLDKGGLIAQGLAQYGGAAGAEALRLYFNEGINTITPDLLKKTGGIIDAAFKAERDTVLKYLADVAGPLMDMIDSITGRLTTQFGIVTANITAAFELAKSKVIGILDEIYAKMLNISKTPLVVNVSTGTGTTGRGGGVGATQYYNESGRPYTNEAYSYWRNATENQWYQGEKGTNIITAYGSTPPWGGQSPRDRYRGGDIPQLQEGGYITQGGMTMVDTSELVLPARIAKLPQFKPFVPTGQEGGSVAPTSKSEGSPPEVHFHFEGATINNYQDFKQDVAKAWSEVYRNGGFHFLPRT